MNEEKKSDSRKATKEHQQQVRDYIWAVVKNVIERGDIQHY